MSIKCMGFGDIGEAARVRGRAADLSPHVMPAQRSVEKDNGFIKIVKS
jgi:hypothetical protein